MRDVALAGAGVSSAFLTSLLLHFLSAPGDLPDVCPLCPLCPQGAEFSLPSFLLGLGIGVLAWPILEAAFLLRSLLLRRLAGRLYEAGYFRVC